MQDYPLADALHINMSCVCCVIVVLLETLFCYVIVHGHDPIKRHGHPFFCGACCSPCIHTVEPPNNGRVWDKVFVLYREVVLSFEVQKY